MTRTNALTLAALATILTLIVPSAANAESQSKPVDLTPTFVAGGIAADELRVVELGGIVIIRGRVTDATQAQAAGVFARNLGYTRVANLIEIVEPIDDAALARLAERQLSRQRSLDGCKIAVSSRGGIVQLNGGIRQDLQADVAIQVIRNIDGVKGVRSNLTRF